MHINTTTLSLAVVLNKSAVRILVARGAHNNTEMIASTFDIYTLLHMNHQITFISKRISIQLFLAKKPSVIL